MATSNDKEWSFDRTRSQDEFPELELKGSVYNANDKPASSSFQAKSLTSFPSFFSSSITNIQLLSEDNANNPNQGAGYSSLATPISLEQFNSLQEELFMLKKRIVKDEDKIKFLKELLRVKEKQIDILNKENERLKADPNQLSHKKQIYSLIDKLQTSEESIATHKQEIFDLKAELQKKDEQIAELKIIANDVEEKDQKNEQLSKFLRNSRTQLRQLGTQKEQLDEKISSLQKEIEFQNKYRNSLDVVNERTLHMQNEIEELKDVIAMNQVVNGEMKAIKDTLEYELNNKNTKIKALEEERDSLNQIIKKRGELENEANKEHHEIVLELEKKLKEATISNLFLEDKIREDKENLASAEAHTISQKEELFNVLSEISLLKNRFDEESRDHENDLKEIEILKKKIEYYVEHNRALKKEMDLKDRNIRSFQSQLRASNILPNSSSAGSVSQMNAAKNSPQFLIEKLRSELQDSKEACQAHQAHSSFLSSEIIKVQREKNLELEIKSETITRLKMDLKDLKKRYHSLSVDSNSNSEKKENNVESEDNDDKQDIIDDLQSKLTLLKKHYFRSMGLVIKIRLAESGISNDFSLDSLYGKIPPNLPIPEWPDWIEKQLSKK